MKQVAYVLGLGHRAIRSERPLAVDEWHFTGLDWGPVAALADFETGGQGNPAPHPAPSHSHPAKPSGAACNLACSYCFFLDKELLYPNSNFRMSDELLETYIRQLIESHRSAEVTVAWQGGEPTLMGLDFFRKAIVLQQKYRRPGLGIPKIRCRPTAPCWTTNGASSSSRTTS